MGFEIEEITPAEEHPYSFRDYITQPLKLSNRIFLAIVSSPKLRYWFLATLLGSIFTSIGSWSVMNRLIIDVRFSGEIPEGAQELVKSMIEFSVRNPLMIFLNSLVGEFLTSLISGLAIFLIARSLAGKGGFSSGIMVAGLRALPSMTYGVLLALMGLSMPEVEWNIEIGPQMDLSGFKTNIPWEVFLQDSLLQLVISVWFLMVLLACYTRGYGMTRSRAAAASLLTWIVTNIFLIIGIFSYI